MLCDRISSSTSITTVISRKITEDDKKNNQLYDFKINEKQYKKYFLCFICDNKTNKICSFQRQMLP